MDNTRIKDSSDTPQTNAAVTRMTCDAGYEYDVVHADFARSRERRITELESAIQEVAELISGHDGHVFDDIAKVLLGTKPWTEEQPPKEEKRPPLKMETVGDITAFLRDGHIVVRDVTTLDDICMFRNEAVALAKWILENFE